MAAAVLMPKAGISVESCIITQWLKQPGDLVAKGDILFSYETDKASFECESTEDGTLLELFFHDGDEVPVLTAVCAVGAPGDNTAGLRPDSAEAESAPAAAKEVVSTPASSAGEPQATPGAAQPFASGNAGKISPRAKNLAARHHIDTTLATPTGPYGRIIERDIRAMMESGVGVMTAAAQASGAAGAAPGTGLGGRVGVADQGSVTAATPAAPVSDGPAYEDIAFTGIRRAISKSMSQSLSTIPQLTHSFTFDATEIMAYRASLKANGEKAGLPNITYNDMLLYAVSRLLPKYPALNAHMLDGNTIRQFKDVHLGMAVDTERGLVVPTIRNANHKSLAQIAVEAKALAKQGQDGTLSPDDMSGGTFTVSNLGIFGVEHFTPVINPPQTGILGVNNIIQRPREKDGQIILYPAMGISLTYDHRAIDGAPASRFAQELCGIMEHFTLLLAK